MQQSAFKFILYTFILAIICACLQMVFNQHVNGYMQLKSGYLLLGIFVAIIISVHLLLLKSAHGTSEGFTRTFMAATAVKLFVYMIVLIYFLLFSQENKKVLVVYFLFYYTVFTIFEVSMLYNDLRKVRQ